jgi:hypothetical protein
LYPRGPQHVEISSENLGGTKGVIYARILASGFSGVQKLVRLE